MQQASSPTSPKNDFAAIKRLRPLSSSYYGANQTTPKLKISQQANNNSMLVDASSPTNTNNNNNSNGGLMTYRGASSTGMANPAFRPTSVHTSRTAANFGAPLQATNKYMEMEHAISNIDVEIANQQKLRRRKQAQLDNLQNSTEGVQQAVIKLDDSIAALDEKIAKLELAYHTEKNARDLAEKSMATMIEERFAFVMNRIEVDKQQKIAENEHVVKRLKQFEETAQNLALVLEREKKNASESAGKINKLSTQIVQVQQQFAGDVKKMKQDGDQQNKLVQQQILDIKSDINTERVQRERGLEMVHEQIKAEIQKIYDLITDERATRERTLKIAIMPFTEELEKLYQQIDSERKMRSDLVYQQQQKSSDATEQIRQFVQQQIATINDTINKEKKVQQEKLFKLNTMIEKEIEERQEQHEQVLGVVENESHMRVEEDANLMKLLNSTMQRVQKSLESLDNDVHHMHDSTTLDQ